LHDEALVQRAFPAFPSPSMGEKNIQQRLGKHWARRQSVKVVSGMTGFSSQKLGCFEKLNQELARLDGPPSNPHAAMDAGHFARHPNPLFDVGVHQLRELLGAVTRGLKALLH